MHYQGHYRMEVQRPFHLLIKLHHVSRPRMEILARPCLSGLAKISAVERNFATKIRSAGGSANG